MKNASNTSVPITGRTKSSERAASKPATNKVTMTPLVHAPRRASIAK
jgi:hypothetical protein